MEAVWNQNNTHCPDHFGVAITSLRENLDQVMADPENVESRRRVQIAALLAGYAMGTTQTALAHSISYPFTAHFDMPHGFACGFAFRKSRDITPLDRPEHGTNRSRPFMFDFDIPDVLEAWFDALELGLYCALCIARRHRPVRRQFDHACTCRQQLTRRVDGGTASLARRSLERFCPT